MADEQCPKCGSDVTEYPTRLKCYGCGWSSEDEGPKRDIRGRKKRRG